MDLKFDSFFSCLRSLTEKQALIFCILNKMSYLCNSFEDVCDFVIAVNLFIYNDNTILITIYIPVGGIKKPPEN